MKPTVVTFWTDDWYAERASRLEASCKEHGLDFIGVERKDTGSWVTNAAQKPTFILGMLYALATPVLWLDADSKVCAEPSLLMDADVDFAARLEPGGPVRVQAGRTDRIRRPNGGPEGWINSGTVYFNQTNAARLLAIRWLAHQRKEPRWYDQWTLQYAWAEVQPHTTWLPPGYCRTRLHRKVQPVIDHEFASQIRRVDRT